MPGTFVVTGLNSPRTSAGASGLRSQVSKWLGPPHMNRKMHRFTLPKPPRLAGDAPAPKLRLAIRCPPNQPAAGTATALSKLRRVTAASRNPEQPVVVAFTAG